MIIHLKQLALVLSSLVLAPFMKTAKKEDAPQLPALKKNDAAHTVEVLPEQHFTQPPPRYSEASLIKTLEELGIGRPSTYAPILDTIVSRNYVENTNKQFVPTELGFVVVDFLIAYFEKIINTGFTRDLEEELDGYCIR